MNLNKTTNIAVLMTCFNRREQTLACLRALFKQTGMGNVYLQVFLVDDGSSDGTSLTVKDNFPEIILLQGDGSLFWNGGMRLAFGKAIQKGGFDYFLWMNDDSILNNIALNVLLNTANLLLRQTDKPCIIVGSMQDSHSGDFSYGGRTQHSYWRPLKFNIVIPGDSPQPCDAINGNCVLIPEEIAQVVGNLSSDFTHGIGDFDYSLRAKKLGFSSWITPGYVGTCTRNAVLGTCRDENLSIEERAVLMAKPTGLPPAQEWMTFTKRHGKCFWPLYWLRTSVRICLPRLWAFIRAQKVTH